MKNYVEEMVAAQRASEAAVQAERKRIEDEKIAAHRARGCRCTGECNDPGPLESMGTGCHAV